MWRRKVFVALCRRYGLKPYRYKRQRYTTVMLRVSQSFVDETLWPEFEQLSETEASVTHEPRQLSLANAASTPPAEATPPPAPKTTPATAQTSEVDEKKKSRRRGKKGKRGKRGGRKRR